MTRILVVLLWLIPCSLFAQRIEGKVVDSEGQPLSFVNIVLLTQRDSTFVTGTTTDTEGLFSLSRPSVGFYLLQFSSIGFETVTLPCPDGEMMQDVTLRPSTTQLGDVVVNGSLPTHKLTADGLQTQVQGTVLGRLGTAEDVLAHVPGLQKKSNGYEVFGKGSPIIYINGRQLRDLSELEQLKSDQVKSVELITSPGARYDASVGAVVRIKTVQPRGEGFGIDARSTWQQSDNADLINQVNLNYQNKGLTVFGMGYFATMGEYQIATVRQDIKADTIWQQRNDLKSPNRRGQLKAQAGLNYIFNDHHALGFRIDARKMLNFHGTTFTISEITANGQPYEHSELFNRDYLINSCTHAANLYYNGQL
ncbi:MAG: carboxypeptidase regulatory-like domain-containing protein, partial [Bacteroidaceae bacterium]|nr:carboxypeptidase regulatory-like domain-containing protein [Bacteroidaceae bacterium]